MVAILKDKNAPFASYFESWTPPGITTENVEATAVSIARKACEDLNKKIPNPTEHIDFSTATMETYLLKTSSKKRPVTHIS